MGFWSAQEWSVPTRRRRRECTVRCFGATPARSQVWTTKSTCASKERFAGRLSRGGTCSLRRPRQGRLRTSQESEVNLRNFFIKQTQSPSIISYHNLGQKNQPASVNTVMIYLTCLPTLIKFPSMFSRRAGRNSQRVHVSPSRKSAAMPCPHYTLHTALRRRYFISSQASL